MDENFYQYQRSRMLIILSWGLASTVSGVGALLTKKPFWKNFWLQCLGWGAIDALIAIFGRRGPAVKLARLQSNSLKPGELQKDITSFRRILLINVFLDVGYIAAGWRLRGMKREDRQGMGLGFIVQGLFLFIFDLALTLEVGGKWLKKA